MDNKPETIGDDQLERIPFPLLSIKVVKPTNARAGEKRDHKVLDTKVVYPISDSK